MYGWIRDRIEALFITQRHSEPAPGDAFVTGMLSSLRAPEGMEPAAGFYARVMQRIEEKAKESIWAAVLCSPMSSRIAYAALTMTILLGTYVVTAESRDGHLTGDAQLTATAHYDVPVTGDLAQQRNAVLQNFAVH